MLMLIYSRMMCALCLSLLMKPVILFKKHHCCSGFPTNQIKSGHLMHHSSLKSLTTQRLILTFHSPKSA